MSIIQNFYDNMAAHYDKLFLDWQASTKEQAELLDRLFRDNGFDRSACVLDCACGIGTQAIGLAALGYDVTGSDISDGELAQAKERAEKTAFPFVWNMRISARWKKPFPSSLISSSLWTTRCRICFAQRICKKRSAASPVG